MVNCAVFDKLARRALRLIRHSPVPRLPLFTALILTLLSCLAAPNALAAEPRYLCTSSSKANLRNGPGTHFSILYVLQKRGYPFLMLEKHDTWYAAVDFQGDHFWIHEQGVTGKNCGVIVRFPEEGDSTPGARYAPIYTKPNEETTVILYLEAGFVLNSATCYKGQWCRVTYGKFSGWMQRDRLWGI